MSIMTCTAQMVFYHRLVVHNTSHNPLLSILAASRDPTYWVCSAAPALQKGTEAMLCIHVTEQRATIHILHMKMLCWYGSSLHGETPHAVLLTLVVVASCNDGSDPQIDDGSDSIIQSLVGTV